MKRQWKIAMSVFMLVLVLLAAFWWLAQVSAPDELVAASEPLVSLPPTPVSVAPVDRLRNVDDVLANMALGSVAFNAPTEINIQDSRQIHLILSLAETTEALKQAVTAEGEKMGATIRVSDRMEARLTGAMFEITTITPEVQAVSKSQSTEWQWEIQSKAEGQHRLYLTLTALLDVDGHPTPRTIKTFSKAIDVKVTSSQKIGDFFINHWQWLWAAILVPVAG